VTIVFQSRQL